MRLAFDSFVAIPTSKLELSAIGLPNDLRFEKFVSRNLEAEIKMGCEDLAAVVCLFFHP
jgi:hypothetical protein